MTPDHAREELHAQIRQAAAELGGSASITELARQFECSRSTVYRAIGTAPYVRAERGELNETNETAEPIVAQACDSDQPSITAPSIEESGNERKITFTIDRLVKTLDELIETAQVDTTVWRVKKWSAKAWSTALRMRRGQDEDGRNQPDAGVVKQLYSVSMELERIQPEGQRDPYLLAMEAVHERIADARAEPTAKRATRSGSRPCMLEIDLFDAHFGKLAWGVETGEDYDLKIAETIFREAVDDIIDEAKGREIEEILFPIGNDFLHVDGPNNQTANGTTVDTDGRFAKIVEVSFMSLAYAFERASQVATVKGKRVPGNHDRVASLHLLNFLAAYFRNDPNVEICRDIKERQYHAYGSSLIGFTHGCEEKATLLPAIMATEVPRLWGESSYREWHLGHFHKSKQVTFANVDQESGVIIRYLQSLSGRDAWHYRRGYVGGRRAAEGMIFDRDKGLVANYQAFLRTA